jgi:hypothetical protein
MALALALVFFPGCILYPCIVHIAMEKKHFEIK